MPDDLNCVYGMRYLIRSIFGATRIFFLSISTATWIFGGGGGVVVVVVFLHNYASNLSDDLFAMTVIYAIFFFRFRFGSASAGDK